MIWRAMRRIARRLAPPESWNRYRAVVSAVGLKAALGYELSGAKAVRGSVFSVKPPRSSHHLSIRAGTSDRDVFCQIFISQEYQPLAALRDVRLVLDCGANVGYSSVYFLTRFPDCHVIAVEPDPGNFAMLQRNLRPYGDRASAVKAGVWSHSVPLTLEHRPYRDGREWTVQVRPSRPGERADFEGITIAALLAGSGRERISLLKMDVEGAEAVIFASNVDWLDRVDAIAIELHDDSHFGKASEIFYSAIRDRGFEVSEWGELTICRQPK